MKRIVAFDPGLTTGVCSVLLDDNNKVKELYSWTIDWDARFSQVQDAIKNHFPSVIVIERFRLYSQYAKHQINNAFPSVEMIGIITTMVYLFDPEAIIVMQSASEISHVAIPPEYQEIVKASEHQRDAFKHLRLWYVKNYTGTDF